MSVPEITGARPAGCPVAGVIVDGVTLRRTLDGRLALAYPERRDREGRRHPYLRPADPATRKALEHQIFEALGLSENGLARCGEAEAPVVRAAKGPGGRA